MSSRLNYSRIRRYEDMKVARDQERLERALMKAAGVRTNEERRWVSAKPASRVRHIDPAQYRREREADQMLRDLEAGEIRQRAKAVIQADE